MDFPEPIPPVKPTNFNAPTTEAIVQPCAWRQLGETSAVADAPPPEIISADYVAEVRALSTVPAVGPAEIAISGRSNVGKSTLLNRLAIRKSLARTSKTPGRTRGIIFYDMVARWHGESEKHPLRLVDLPGYGYAQVSATERRGWGPLVEGYVASRDTLKLVLVLVDARRGLEDEERQLCEWLASKALPQRLVLTKADKLTAAERGSAKAKITKELGEAAPVISLVSANSGEGIPALWGAMRRALVAPPR